MKFKAWLFDTAAGILVCSGLVLLLWLLLYSIFEFPVFNFINVSFAIEVIALFWVTNFIFHFSSRLLAKGILHSIICFMLSVILFSLNFGFVPSAHSLILYMLGFFTCYCILLYGSWVLSKKLNCPFRHFPEWLGKLRPKDS